MGTTVTEPELLELVLASLLPLGLVPFPPSVLCSLGHVAPVCWSWKCPTHFSGCISTVGWLRRGVVLVGCWKGCRGEELGLLAHRREVGWRGGFSGAWGGRPESGHCLCHR